MQLQNILSIPLCNKSEGTLNLKFKDHSIILDFRFPEACIQIKERQKSKSRINEIPFHPLFISGQVH